MMGSAVGAGVRDRLARPGTPPARAHSTVGDNTGHVHAQRVVMLAQSHGPDACYVAHDKGA